MEIIQGGVTAAKGFKAAGMNAGIKNKTKKDMAMIFSEKPCVTAGTFTTNKVFAAPVKWDKNIVYNRLLLLTVVLPMPAQARRATMPALGKHRQYLRHLGFLKILCLLHQQV